MQNCLQKLSASSQQTGRVRSSDENGMEWPRKFNFLVEEKNIFKFYYKVDRYFHVPHWRKMFSQGNKDKDTFTYQPYSNFKKNGSVCKKYLMYSKISFKLIKCISRTCFASYLCWAVFFMVDLSRKRYWYGMNYAYSTLSIPDFSSIFINLLIPVQNNYVFQRWRSGLDPHLHLFYASQGHLPYKEILLPSSKLLHHHYSRSGTIGPTIFFSFTH